MCFKRCVAFNLYIISPKIYLLPVYNIQKIEKLDDTHLLKHIKQAILVWSFRQNLFLGSLHQKSSISTHDGATVLVPWYKEAGTLQIGAVMLKLP